MAQGVSVEIAPVITQLGDDPLFFSAQAPETKLCIGGNDMRTIARLALAVAIAAVCQGPLQANAVETVANVKGSYAFKFIGTDYAVTGKQIVATGVFTADGAGGISAGSISYNDGGDLCTSTTLSANGSNYNIVSDGEGTLTLQFSAFTGICPIEPTFEFAIAISLAKSTIEQHVQMSSTTFSVNGGSTTTSVPVDGNAEHE